MKIDIDPKRELFRWGPIDGLIVYPDFFNVGFTLYAKIFYSWPDVVWLCENEKITCVVDYAELRLSGKKNFNQFILNDQKLDKYYRQWLNTIRKLLLVQKKISSENLKKVSTEKLMELYDCWSDTYLN